ncbi:MAG: hypothetical protein ABI721_05725 [Candidatus Dojkabacteria bacterium]
MGLFDFLSSKPTTAPSKTSGLVVSPSQGQNYSYQNSSASVTPAASADYKDIQYPMPQASNQLGATVLPDTKSLTPQGSYVTEKLPVPVVLPTATPESHAETILDNGVRQVTYTNPQPQMTPELSTIQPETQPEDKYAFSQPPQPAVTTPVMETPAETNLTGAGMQSVLNNPEPISTTPTTEQPQPEGVVVNPPTEQISAQAEEDSSKSIGDIIEIGKPTESIDTPVEPVTALTTETTPTEPKDIMETPVPEVTPPVETDTTLTVKEPETESIKPISTPVPEELPEIPAVEVETPSSVPEITMPDVEETKVPELKTSVESVKTENLTQPIVTENKIEEVVDVDLKVFNRIAFVCLNSQSVNSSLSKKVKSLAEMFKNTDTEIFIDSNKGYGMDVISGLAGTKNKLTAAYLKPFFSKYSDETTLDIPVENLAKTIFSNLKDRVQYLSKEANIFIIPETSGLTNLSQLMMFLSLQSMYYGTHKPVILFGMAWKNRMSSLKDSFGLSQQEMSSMYFASTPEEAMDTIKQLDKEFSEKKLIAKSQVMDLRNEEEERNMIMS